MKKITLLSFSFLFSIAMMAQSKFQLGFKASPNIHWLKTDVEGVDRDGVNFGFNFGVLADFNISERYSFSTGVESVTVGGDTETKNSVLDFEDKYTAKYIEVPISLKLKTNQIGYITYFGQFGLTAGVNYDANGETTVAGVTTKRSNRQEDMALFRGAIMFGAGMEYNISGSTSLLLGVTFNNGITNIYSKDARDDYEEANKQLGNNNADELKAITNYLALNIGIIF
tara:strand:- start:2831 stop:3511 length:681 start_codon:yes stop_codon:yes gene_type:complete